MSNYEYVVTIYHAYDDREEDLGKFDKFTTALAMARSRAAELKWDWRIETYDTSVDKLISRRSSVAGLLRFRV